VAVDELRQRGTQVMTIVADLRRRDDIETSIQLALAHYDHIDILVHNAGGAKGEDIFDTREED
jgi:3-oxoacyl-[acyl-carrier protein] reductase